MELTKLARGVLEGELKRLRQSRDIHSARLAGIDEDKRQTEQLIAVVDAGIVDIESVLNEDANG